MSAHKIDWSCLKDGAEGQKFVEFCNALAKEVCKVEADRDPVYYVSDSATPALHAGRMASLGAVDGESLLRIAAIAFRWSTSDFFREESEAPSDEATKPDSH